MSVNGGSRSLPEEKAGRLRGAKMSYGDPLRHRPGRRLILAAVGLFAVLLGCGDDFYPEVVVVNNTAKYILIRNLSFNGCSWNTVLAYGDATSPGRALPGEDRIHFEMFDAQAYCRDQVHDGTIAGLCFCDSAYEPADSPIDAGLINEEPFWFNYQTKTAMKVDYTEFHRVEIVLDEIEQDFSVPGPYGH